MFTGIITHIGKLNKRNHSICTFVADQSFCKKLKKGTSVSINGVCLTVFDKPKDDAFCVEIMPQTLKKTMLEKLEDDDLVNLELPTTTKTLFSGHIVTGHIDGVGVIKEVKVDGNSRVLTITMPQNLGRYVVEKGSIAINGISLTVIDVAPTYFTVGIIPYTWEHTMLPKIRVGDSVNIEVDTIAKYVEKLLETRNL